MRLLLLFLLSVLSGSSLFSKGVYSGETHYEIVSSHYQESIDSGYFLINGVIKDNATGEAIPNAVATTANFSQQEYTDMSGVFSLKVSVKDSVIYCYASGYSEIQIKGPFKNKHMIQVRIFLNEEMEVAYKPVIYAYNADQVINLSLKPKGHFSFTYPQTPDGTWKVNTNPDGTLNNPEDGKNYPYLFWEGDITGLHVQQKNGVSKGFLIHTDSCVSFLENTLAAYGLNERESTDFITFWGPKMIEKEFAFVQFLSTEQYGDIIASLDIYPQPESLLRLYMYLVPLDKNELPFEVETPEIQPLIRKGFTIIEWGGSVLKPEKYLN